MSTDGHFDPLVSLVVTTRNEEANIASVLASVRNQTYRNIELIVIDNDSSDRTKEIAEQYTKSVYDKGPERSAQRNYGMMNIAVGEYVMFVDADMILSPLLIAACVDFIRQEKCPALYIPEIILGKGYWPQVRRFERSFYDGTVIDGVRFIKRDVFIQVGGFDETLSGGEDWDLDKKIKKVGPVCLLPATYRPFILHTLSDQTEILSGKQHAIYHNESNFSLSRYLLKKRYYTRFLDGYVEKWGKEDKDIQKQLGLQYRFFGIFFEDDKGKKLMSHPLLALGMYFLRFMVGLVYLSRKFRYPPSRVKGAA